MNSRKVTNERRTLNKVRQKLSELKFCREILKETKELYAEYDLELNFVLDETTTLVSGAPVKDNISTEIVLSETVEDNVDSETNNSQTDNSQDKFNSDNNSVEESNTPESPQWMKKLFKKIAFETHPDRLINREDLTSVEKTQREEWYKEAQAAFDAIDGLPLLEIAEKLQVSISISLEEQLEIITAGIITINQQIKGCKDLVGWAWGENEGNIDVRVKLIQYVRAYLKMIIVDEKMIKDYIIEFEGGSPATQSDLQEFKNRKAKVRKPGSHPGPRLQSIRKQQ